MLLPQRLPHQRPVSGQVLLGSIPFEHITVIEEVSMHKFEL